MLKFVIFTDSMVVTTALKGVVTTLYTDEQTALDVDKQVLARTLPASFANLGERQQTFDNLSEWLDGILYDYDRECLNQVVACASMSMSTIDDMNPLCKKPNAASVLGMLILAFPEIQWVVGDGTYFPLLAKGPVPINAKTAVSTFPMSLENAVERMKAGHVPLFDGDGTRNALYDMIRTHTDSKNLADYLPLRRHMTVAIDEEKNYAYFNAYTAYRFGFRAYSVSTLKMMELLLKDKDLHPDAVFEDIYLNFPDRAGDDHLSEFYKPGAPVGEEGRDTRFPAIRNARFRIQVTCGGGGARERKTRRSNEHYLKIIQKRKLWPNSSSCSYLDGARKWWSHLQKPVSGVFDIFHNSGLEEWTRSRKSPFFLWPPKPKAKRSSPDAPSNGGGHSSPGAISPIAYHLLARAERMLGSVQNAEEAVRGAVLCNIACELLGCLTPTIALEALSLKHQFEALAECQFYGVQANVDVKKRMQDLYQEADTIGRCFDGKTRKLSVLNGKAAIVGSLVKLYRAHNRFDEEQQCLIQARELGRKIWMAQHPVLQPVGWAWWYVNFLTRSLSNFVLALFAWWAGLSLLMLHMGAPLDSHLIVDSASVFFGIQPATTTVPNIHMMAALSIIGMIAGFVHLGIFISHIYSIISRR